MKCNWQGLFTASVPMHKNLEYGGDVYEKWRWQVYAAHECHKRWKIITDLEAAIFLNRKDRKAEISGKINGKINGKKK